MRYALLVLLLTACSRLEPLVELDQSCHRTDVLEPGLLPQRVQWLEAQSEGDENLNALWCETVGPALFDPSPAPPADTARAITDSLAVISWNTHVGGGEIERLVHDLRAGRFTKGDSVRHFVLLLQEVYRASDSIPASVRIGVPSRIAENPPSGQREDILATAGRLGLALLYIPSMRNGVGKPGSREDRGNAVLSSLPLKDPVAIELPIERQRRVVAGVTVEGETTSGDSWKQKLFSVHLDNRSRTTRPTATFGVARLRQARALVEVLKDEDGPIGIAGDLNTWSIGFLERAIPHLREAFPDSPEPVPGITYVHGNVRRRIDYMFFRLPDGWSARYERVDRTYGSDHYPLLGWVRIGAEDDGARLDLPEQYSQGKRRAVLRGPAEHGEHVVR